MDINTEIEIEDLKNEVKELKKQLTQIKEETIHKCYDSFINSDTDDDYTLWLNSQLTQ